MTKYENNERSMGEELDLLSTQEILEHIHRGDLTVAPVVGEKIPHIGKVVEAICAHLAKGGRLFYIGAGTSGRLGVLDASECPPTFNTRPEMVQGMIAGGPGALTRSVEGAEDSLQAGALDLQNAGFSKNDFLVGIAASGRTPYVLGAVAYARQLGAATAGISCTRDSELSRVVEFPIETVTGPEIIAGSTRMRAGTATKMVLNMISTGVMIRLGYVYGNLMVNVQPANQKLKQRACGMIRQITGATEERAEFLLNAAGNRVPVAIVMEKKNATREQAEQILQTAGGRLRAALG